jgi:hypothetical protein
VFVFPDGLTYDIDNFFAGLEGDLPSERFLPIWGGGAGNNLNLGKPTYQYCDDEVVSDGVSYALLSGEAQTAWAISHSVIPIGGARRVTRCKGNIIYEIDGKPAAEVLKEYLPEDALTDERDWLRYAISLVLTIEAPSYMMDEEYVVRGVPQLNLTDESITVQTEVQEGTSIWFSSRDKEKITSGFDRMATQIEEQLDGAQPELVFQFECVRTRSRIRRHVRQARSPPRPEDRWLSDSPHCFVCSFHLQDFTQRVTNDLWGLECSSPVVPLRASRR